MSSRGTSVTVRRPELPWRLGDKRAQSNCSVLSRRTTSSSLTAVRLAEGHSADALRALILRRFNMSLGNGLGILKDRVFRIGHLGDINDLTLLGAISGVEMGLKLSGVPIGDGGVDAAMAVLMAAEED